MHNVILEVWCTRHWSADSIVVRHLLLTSREMSSKWKLYYKDTIDNWIVCLVLLQENAVSFGKLSFWMERRENLNFFCFKLTKLSKENHHWRQTEETNYPRWTAKHLQSVLKICFSNCLQILNFGCLDKIVLKSMNSWANCLMARFENAAITDISSRF